MDARDIALQQSAPVVTVPRYGGFTPLTDNGHRFLVTGDGLWLEARRPWLYLRVPLAHWAGAIADLRQDSTESGRRLLSVCRRSVSAGMRRLDRVECDHGRDAAGIPGGSVLRMQPRALHATGAQ